MKKLDEIALNIELVLISIIEGVALISLAESAEPILHSADWLLYLPFIIAGLLILLVFWSQAILHAVSFIRWPLRMEHMLLYFVAAFLQVIAYSNMTDLAGWFFWWSIFSVLAIVIYFVDLKIIRDTKEASASHHKAFMHEVEKRHVFELKYLVPIALLYNLVGLALAVYVPAVEESRTLYATLGIVQALVSFGALYDCIRNFKERGRMIPTLFSE